jgi:hypothetical protein
MPRTQRVAQYIQQLALEKIFQDEANETPPDDAPTRAGDENSNYAAWNATSFSAYVPFRGPING